MVVVYNGGNIDEITTDQWACFMAWYHVYVIPATTRMLLVSTSGRPIWPLHMANNALIVYLWFGTSCYTSPNQLMWCTQKTYERLSLWSQAEWIISLCQIHRCFLWLCLTTSKRVPHTDRVWFALVCETNVHVYNASEKLCIMFAASVNNYFSDGDESRLCHHWNFCCAPRIRA